MTRSTAQTPATKLVCGMNQHTATAARALAKILGDAVTKIGNTLIATARLVPSLTRWDRDPATESMVAKCAGVDALCAHDRAHVRDLRRDITDVGGIEPMAMKQLVERQHVFPAFRT